MSRFFEDDTMIDRGAQQSQQAAQSGDRFIEPEANTSGGVSNQYYLNDYRNRMPFHYVEEGNDGYYYWHYGATMVIEVEMEDLSIAHTDDTPLFVVDVRRNGDTVVDSAMIADILLGTMADESKEDYFTKTELTEQITAIWNTITARATTLHNYILQVDDRGRQTRDTLAAIFTRVLEGNNISISREGDPTTIAIHSNSVRHLPVVVFQGIGSIENPFIATTSQQINWDLENTLITVLFAGLHSTGLQYNTQDTFYMSFQGTQSTITRTFRIQPTSQSDTGTLYNSTYFILNDVLVDTETTLPLKAFTANHTNYEVRLGTPFIFIKGNKTYLSINGYTYTTAYYTNPFKGTTIEQIQIASLPRATPILASVVLHNGHPTLFINSNISKKADIQDIIGETVIDANTVAFEAVELEEADWS